MHIIGKIDIEIYRCVTADIQTSDVIITQQQIEHIQELSLIHICISRFGRNTLDTIQTLRELKDLDVTVIFDQEHLDTSKEDSEVILTTLAAFAEEENKNRRDNQNWAIKKRLKDGTSEIYSRACFGYTKSDIGELTIDRKQAEIVQNIFTMYLSGMSILGIVKELERQGIKSPTGKDLSLIHI